MNKPTTTREVPSTREILGEHLHQKVKEVYGDNGIKDRLVSRITGILLETPVESIYKMLIDADLLKDNVKIAAEYVEEIRTLIGMEQEEQERPHDSNASEHGLDQQLYDRVYSLDPHLAPQITGMLLELDKETVTYLLHDPTKFLSAFEKPGAV